MYTNKGHSVAYMIVLLERDRGAQVSDKKVSLNQIALKEK